MIEKESKQLKLKRFLVRIQKKITRNVNRILYRPSLNLTRHNYRLLKFGSSYGGWSFVDSQDLYNSTIISCGLGEDASFDIEFASKFNSKIILVDPTPRAINHFKEITENFGSHATVSYTNDGKQPMKAYDLSKLNAQNFQIIDRALWIKSTALKFYCPLNPNHVSHSIVNYQNNYRQDSDYIEVEAITIDSLLESMGIESLPLIKLDIEGAEIQVLNDMMQKKILPAQILVEYDELATPSRLSKSRIESAHRSLLENGYKLINFDSPSNFLYVRATPNRP